MKKSRFILFICALVLCGCNHHSTSSEQSAADSTSIQQEALSSTSSKKIKKTIPLGAEFTNLILVSGANVIYTQGNYLMEVECDSSLLPYLQTEIDSNVLTISFGSERNKDFNVYEGKLDVNIHLSAPVLDCVSVCSSGDFTAKGRWVADNMQMGIIGSGIITCDSIECKNFSYQATGEGNGSFVHVKANKIHFANMRSGTVKADVDTELLQCDNIGSSPIIITGKANKREFNASKIGKILFN